MTTRITPDHALGAFLVELQDEVRGFMYSIYVDSWDTFLLHESAARECYERHTQAIERERLGASS